MIHFANYRQCFIGLSVLLSTCNKQKVKWKKIDEKKRRAKSLQVNITNCMLFESAQGGCLFAVS